MALYEYKENEQNLWRFYLNIRSKRNPRIRLQRRGAGYSTQSEADHGERKALIQMTSELARLESVGSTWSDIVERWERFHEMYPSHRYT